MIGIIALGAIAWLLGTLIVYALLYWPLAIAKTSAAIDEELEVRRAAEKAAEMDLMV